MKISPIILHLRTWCPSFEKRIGGTVDLPTAEESTHLKLPCAFVLAPRDESSDPITLTRYTQDVSVTFDVMLYVSSKKDERGLDAYDTVDDLKLEVIKAIAGCHPEDCNEWIVYDGGQVESLNAAYMAYRMSFKCQYRITDDGTMHGVEIAGLPDFLRLHTDFLGTDGDPEGKTPIARLDIKYPKE